MVGQRYTSERVVAIPNVTQWSEGNKIVTDIKLLDYTIYVQSFFKRILDFTLAPDRFNRAQPHIPAVVVVVGSSQYQGSRSVLHAGTSGEDERIFRVVKFKTMTDKRDSEGNLLTRCATSY